MRSAHCFLVVVLLSAGLLACGSSAPPCAFLELEGETVGGGGILLEEPLDSGDRAGRAIVVNVSEVPDVPAEDYESNYTIDCDDDGCPVRLECSPDIIDAGQAMYCDVHDETEEGTEACTWSCRVAFDVSHGDTSICSPARISYEIAGTHEPEE